MNDELLNELLDSSLQIVKSTYNIIETYRLESSQSVLNWLDKLNEISVKN